MTLAHIDHDTVLRFVAAFAQMTFPLPYADGEAWVRDAGFDPGDQPWDAFGPEGSQQAGVLVIKSSARTDLARTGLADRVLYAHVTITEATDTTTDEELNNVFTEQTAMLTDLLGKPTKKTRAKTPTITWDLPNHARIRLVLGPNVQLMCDTPEAIQLHKASSRLA